MIKTEQLQLILTLAKAGSFHKAAEVLYISQPALSNSLKKLEGELDVTLFERHPTGVKPTEIGQKILPLAKSIVNDLNTILLLCTEHTLTEQQPITQQHITMTSYPAVIDALLPEVFAELKYYLPHTDIVTRSISYDAPLPLPQDNEVIFFYECADSPLSLTDGYIKHIISPIEPAIIMHKDFLVPAPSVIKETDLLELPLITLLHNKSANGIITTLLLEHLHTIGQPQIVTDVLYTSMYRSCLEKKLGVGFSMLFGLTPLKNSSANMITVPLKHTMPQSFCFSLMYRSHFPSPISTIIRQVISNQLLT